MERQSRRSFFKLSGSATIAALALNRAILDRKAETSEDHYIATEISAWEQDARFYVRGGIVYVKQEGGRTDQSVFWPELKTPAHHRRAIEMLQAQGRLPAINPADMAAIATL